HRAAAPPESSRQDTPATSDTRTTRPRALPDSAIPPPRRSRRRRVGSEKGSSLHPCAKSLRQPVRMVSAGLTIQTPLRVRKIPPPASLRFHPKHLDAKHRFHR